MQATLKDQVRARAENRCEYCRLRQEHSPFATFHVEHIRAKQHGGGDTADNLALACDRCNAFKGPNLTGIDVESDNVVPLFNPRIDAWEGHFRFDGPIILGLTPTGRATVSLLGMNERRRVHLRQKLMEYDEFD